MRRSAPIRVVSACAVVLKLNGCSKCEIALPDGSMYTCRDGDAAMQERHKG